jgi:hypothetical protein
MRRSHRSRFSMDHSTALDPANFSYFALQYVFGPRDEYIIVFYIRLQYLVQVYSIPYCIVMQMYVLM